MTLCVTIFSCKNSDTSKVLSDTTAKQQTDTTETKSERQILIEELKRLQGVFASNDKEKIADLFKFPISNETVGIYIDDSTFNAQLDKNGNKVSRAMFIRFYRDISEGLQIDQVNQLFRRLNIDNLLQRDTLNHEAIIKSEPCFHYYGVTVENNLVTLTLGLNSNRDYVSKNVSEEEVPENDSSVCEHVLWWTFTFDRKRLQFKEITGAG